MDYERFISLLFFCNSYVKVDMKSIKKLFSEGDTFADFIGWRGKTLVDIGAFCLMPNHFHLLIHEKENNGITTFIKKVGTAYSMYFNLKYKRKGKLFEGVFCATHADNDRYLKHLFTYIHLNPLKLSDPNWKENGVEDMEDACTRLSEYPYSSLRTYQGKNVSDAVIINPDPFPEYFLEKDMEASIKEWFLSKSKFGEGDTFTKVGITSFFGFLLLYNQIMDLAIFS